MRAPSASFWRHSLTIRRKSWGKDAALAMVPSNADAGQTVIGSVQEQAQGTRPNRVETGDSITAHSFFDVLIPATNPTTGIEQFPAVDYPDGPAIRLDDSIEFGGRVLRVLKDVDPAGRGGMGLVFCAYCMEIV